jgi:hypothetical protein
MGPFLAFSGQRFILGNQFAQERVGIGFGHASFSIVFIVVIMSSNRNITGGFDKPAHVESTVFDKSVSPLRR